MIKEIYRFTIFEHQDGTINLYNNEKDEYMEIKRETMEQILFILNQEWERNSEKIISSKAE